MVNVCSLASAEVPSLYYIFHYPTLVEFFTAQAHDDTT